MPIKPSMSSAATTGLGAKHARLSETSVLAPAFVPEVDRQVNLRPVFPGYMVEAPTVPSLDPALRLINSNLVFPTPCCCISMTTSNGDDGAPCDWQEPHVQKLVPDYRFALFPTGSDMDALQSAMTEVQREGRMDDHPQLYFKRYERLLFFEYREMLRLYERYSQYHVLVMESPTTASTTNKNQSHTTPSVYSAMLYVRGIADARPAIQPNDIVLLRPHHDHTSSPDTIPTVEIHSRVIHITRSKDGSMDKITITWITPEQKTHLFGTGQDPTKLTYAIRFIPSTSLWERSLTALIWTHRALCHTCTPSFPSRLSQFLFPTQPPILPPLNTHEIMMDDTDLSMLSVKQKQFVHLVLQRTQSPSQQEIRPPLILTGPAGTGKTRTLLAAIRQVLSLHPNHKSSSSAPTSIHRVLICTPSHTAADVITQRLSKYYDKHTMFRLYDADRPVSTVPLPILPYTCFSPETGSFTLPTLASQLLNFQIYICTCSDAHLFYQMGLTNSNLRQRKKCFQNFIQLGLKHNQMTIASSNTDNSDISSCIQGAHQLHFSHLFVDEAAQAMEPELLIPLSVVLDPFSSQGNQAEVVLVGDPRQLSPQVYSYSMHRGGDATFYDLTCPMIERFLRLPSMGVYGRKADLLGPLCDDNLNTMDDIVKFAFQFHSMSTHPSGYDSILLLQKKEEEKETSVDHTNSTPWCVFLTMNYRGHASFLMMPSALFYEDRLQTQHECSILNKDVGSDEVTKENVDEKWLSIIRLIENSSEIVDTIEKDTYLEFDEATKKILPGKLLSFQKQLSWPIHFRGIVGKDICETVDSISGSNSWCNPEEANIVVDIISKICFEGQISTADIGVMAPYRSQVVLIRNLLRMIGLGGVNVGIVEDYQGVEKHIIILSLTRSNECFVQEDVKQRMGLFQQPMRMNVALTRAENVFIVIGNPHLMVRDPLWRHWLAFCFRNGLWYGESLNPREIYLLDGYSKEPKKTGICHVLRKLPPTGLYPEVEGKCSDETIQSESKSNQLPYVLMSSIERRTRTY